MFNLTFLINLYMYSSVQIPYMIPLTYLILILIWNIPVLKTRNNTIYIKNEKKKKIICLFYGLLAYLNSVNKIVFLALLTNLLLHIYERIRRETFDDIAFFIKKNFLN